MLIKMDAMNILELTEFLQHTENKRFTKRYFSPFVPSIKLAFLDAIRAFWASFRGRKTVNSRIFK